MRHYACLYADTLTIHHFQDFPIHENLPKDIPHKNILWREWVEIHPPFDPKTEEEEGTIQKITETQCITTHLIVPKKPIPVETPEQIQSRTLRLIQSSCFSEDRLPLSMLVLELYNEVRILKGQEPILVDDFKKVLQHYAT